MRHPCIMILLLAGVCSAQTAAIKPATLPDGVTVERDLSYSNYKQTVMDVFQSRRAAPHGKHPGVIIIHGDGWGDGSKEAMVERFVLPYLEQGFVVANVEYRLADAAPAPAAVEDVLLAADWFRKHADKWNVDSKRIVVTGEAAGGHLALMVGMTPKSAHLGPVRKTAAVINFYGITDVEDQLEGINKQDFATKWLPDQKNRFDLARKLSPLTYVRKKQMPAILTIHSNADEIVPYDQAIQLTKACRDAHADAEMINVPNVGHGFTAEKMKQLYPQVFDFLRRRGILK